MDLILTISRSLVLGLIGILCVSASLRLKTTAQVAPVYDRGVMGLAQVLKRLNTSASAMMIGAHPDDEDTALLAYLARGENARTAYLSLTRGDGGQNIIGPELGEALGVIRTEELLQARRLDGAEQYFTRAYDYGFSKTLAEAQAKWPESVVLCDAVRAIREFRPLVVISQFSGTPADGHGQHQYSGYIAPIAVKAAADATQCRDAGPPWNVKKFYVRHGFRATGEPQLKINTGKFDPILGRSYFEIAMEARSQHKSQEQGVLELKGEMFSGMNLVDGVPGINGMFDGIDTSVNGIPVSSRNTETPFKTALTRVADIAKRAFDSFDARFIDSLAPTLAEGYQASLDAELSTERVDSKALVKRKRNEFRDALRLASGLQIDALADRETVVPGEKLPVTIRVFAPFPDAVKVKSVKLIGPTGWEIAEIENPKPQQQGFFRGENPNTLRTFSVTVAADAKPTGPYWLAKPRNGDLYEWPNSGFVTHPFQLPILVAEITVNTSEKDITFEQPVEYRFADDVRGEVRRSLAVVPALSLSLDQDMILVARSTKGHDRKISVTVTSHSNEPLIGDVLVTPLRNGSTSSNGQGISLQKKGEKATIPFLVEIPANTPVGIFPVSAVATVGKKQEFAAMRTIQYPHIQTHRIYGTATARVNVLDVASAPVKVGYIAGSGDRIPDAIKQLGVNVTTIEAGELASGDLSKYDTIIVGIRAYQVRPDLVANNKRLMDFTNAGGTLIVQYQLPGYTQQNLAPFPAQQGPRTSDENAVVNILVSDHPVMNFPNKLAATDFEGWVQERNLYNFSTMDAKYVGLLESHDAGEAENKGGLVIADVGKGKYIYCSYSLFRQLPAGVPGAYRLLANMISLPKAK